MENYAACEVCKTYADIKGLEYHNLPAAMLKDKKMQSEIDETKASMTGESDFKKQGLIENNRSVYAFVESFDFLPKSQFKQDHDCTPEECKLSVVKVADGRGQQHIGVMLKDGNLPKIEVRTEYELVCDTPLADQGQHMFADQMRQMHMSQVEIAGRTYGQTLFSGRYAPKKKKAETYDLSEVLAAVQARTDRHRLVATRQTPLDRLAAGEDIGQTDSDED